MVLEILPRGLQRLLGRLGAGGVEIGVVGLIEGDPVLLDLHEEEAAMGETVVHLVERMDDEVDGRAQRLLDRVGADQLLLGLAPIGGAIGQLLLADDDENVVIRFIKSEEHTSELQSLMRISYAVFCLKKKNK